MKINNLEYGKDNKAQKVLILVITKVSNSLTPKLNKFKRKLRGRGDIWKN